MEVISLNKQGNGGEKKGRKFKKEESSGNL